MTIGGLAAPIGNVSVAPRYSTAEAQHRLKVDTAQPRLDSVAVLEI